MWETCLVGESFKNGTILPVHELTNLIRKRSHGKVAVSTTFKEAKRQERN